MPIKRRRKRKGVVVNEETAHGADGNGIWVGNGLGRDTDERSERKKKGAKVEEMAKEDRAEEPVKEKMFVTTDEQGRLKMLPVRARATRHDEEPGASANANLQLSEIQPSRAQAEVPSPPLHPPPAMPMVPVGSGRTSISTAILLSNVSDTLRARLMLLSWLLLQNCVW